MEKLNELRTLNQQQGLKVTMTLPTHRTAPDNKQDPIVLKNLIAQTSDKLLENMDQRQADAYLNQLESIQNDRSLFNNTLEGLIIYLTSETFEIIRVAKELKESVTVSEYFNLLPYLSYQDQQKDVLAIDLSKDRFKLYDINRYSVDELILEDIHQNFTDLYDDYDTQSTLSTGSYSGTASYHGHRDAGEEIDNDTEKYFRYINRELLEKFKKDERPWVVFGTTENIVDFKSISDFEFESIDKPMKSLNETEIKRLIDEVIKKQSDVKSQSLQDRIEVAYSKRLISNDLETIIKDVKEGKVEMILIQDDLNPDLNELIMDALDTSVEIHFKNNLEQPILAINRY